MLVVGVSMLKEAREDYKRYCQDKEVNERPTRVMDNDTGGRGQEQEGEGECCTVRGVQRPGQVVGGQTLRASGGVVTLGSQGRRKWHTLACRCAPGS